MGLFDFFKSIVGRNNSGSAVEVSGQTTAFVERRRHPRVNARDGTRVLIIDDSSTIAIALRKMLGSVGFIPLHAPDAEEGLEMAQKELPELIFLDIVLPGMNGFAALRALRRDARTRQIPVIMMSGNEKATEQFFGIRIGGLGGLGMAATPLVGGEDPPAVTPVPEPGTYLMLVSGLALLY